MANLKKANKDAEVEVKVDVTPDAEAQGADVTPAIDVAPVENPTMENESTPDEEKNDEQVETKEDDVEVTPADAPKVDVDVTPVNPATQATQKNVRIRMRADHKCWLNSEVYELKKGQCYTVPVSLKKRLNKAGLLLPL